MRKILLILIYLPGLIYSQIDTTDINKLNSKNEKTGVWKEVILPDQEQNISDTLVAYFNYKKGVKNGTYEVYNSDKIILVKGNYNNGEQHGKISNYYSNGKIKHQFNKIDNSYDGPFISYWENGKMKTYKYYVNGKTKEVKHYYEDGNIWIKIEINSAEPEKEKWEVYHENGKLKAEGFKIKDEKNGIWKEYSNQGELKTTNNY